MKVGDLVKMKREVWWMAIPGGRKNSYVHDHGIVYGLADRGIKVLMPDNIIKVSLADYWEVVSECE